MDTINPSKPLGSIPPVGGRSSPSQREKNDSRNAKGKKSKSPKENRHENDDENTMVSPADDTSEQEKSERKGTRIDIQV